VRKKKMNSFIKKSHIIIFVLLILTIAPYYILFKTASNRTKNNSFADGQAPFTIPEVLPTDRIYKSRSAFVLLEYKLIFFTFPKVACSEWKRMFMRMNDNPKWCIIRGINAHDPKVNQIKTLEEYPIEIATAMMTSPSWTRAAFVREPKERVLSSFLDKSVKESYFESKCCNNIDDPKMKEKCISGKRDFSSFLYFVSKFPNACYDVHWEAQVEKIDEKWWPYINFIGHQKNLISDSRQLLETLTSTRDPIPKRTAWQRYGISGWGATNDGCENRTRSFLEENSSSHKLDTGSHLKEWYTAESELKVEEIWAIEWSSKRIQLPKISLYKN